MKNINNIRMTEYSHGSGCGCKITPALLTKILENNLVANDDKLLVGNQNQDDAAVYALDDKTAIISTTDFFMPIVDDPFIFGQIAATNAISDVFAMGGTPLVAVAIFGWPLDKLSVETGRMVIAGGRKACQDVGINLAGGHSIDAPEPIFGLAVTGKVKIKNLKRNNTARVKDWLFLTKPLGVGVLTTAQKKQLVAPVHAKSAEQTMCSPNSIGQDLAKLEGVSSMTDVTGFGLGGHLLEMCESSGLGAEIYYNKLPLLPAVTKYIAKGCVPGGTRRNFSSYGDKISTMTNEQKAIICDPQTSGGLLAAVTSQGLDKFKILCAKHNLVFEAIGRFVPATNKQKTLIIL